ncbi:hypothetical protein AYL99_06316 [Fonsecaea erecta]|uniref:Uncharacterized protein n=1 Tax=Fonsecaea erecta TaxID=1367422 RepID=A0A178ZGU5_9EURO|nr:hypothetical protein AYL99_06316 [Fonsecaea erecta]OAP59019.1 hypothetical protein AYL99_06316 [Fonsecaea erecta]
MTAFQESDLMPVYFVDKVSNMRVPLPISRATTWSQLMTCLSEASAPIAAQVKNNLFRWTDLTTTGQTSPRLTQEDGRWLFRTATLALREGEEHHLHSEWRVVTRKTLDRLRKDTRKDGISYEVLHTAQYIRDEEATRMSAPPSGWGNPFTTAPPSFTTPRTSGPASLPTLYHAAGPAVQYQPWQTYEGLPANLTPLGHSVARQFHPADNMYRSPRNQVRGPPPAYGSARPQHYSPYQSYGSPAMGFYPPTPGFLPDLPRPPYPIYERGPIPTPRPVQHPTPPVRARYPPSFSAPSQLSVPAIAPSPAHIAIQPVATPARDTAFARAPATPPRAPTLPRAPTPTSLSPWTRDMVPPLIVDSADIHWRHREATLREKVRIGRAPIVDAMDLWTEKSKPRY